MLGDGNIVDPGNLIFLSGFACKGDETSVLQCVSLVLYEESCELEKIARVTCGSKLAGPIRKHACILGFLVDMCNAAQRYTRIGFLLNSNLIGVSVIQMLSR